MWMRRGHDTHHDIIPWQPAIPKRRISGQTNRRPLDIYGAKRRVPNVIIYTTYTYIYMYIRETHGRYKPSIGLPYARARLVQINVWNTIEGGNKCALGIFLFNDPKYFRIRKLSHSRNSPRLYSNYIHAFLKKRLIAKIKKNWRLNIIRNFYDSLSIMFENYKEIL